MLKKSLAVAAVAVILLGLVWACSDTGTESWSQQPTLLYSQGSCRPGSETYKSVASGVDNSSSLLLSTSQSACLPGSEGAPGYTSWPGGSVRFVVSYDTLFVYHDSALYQCCAKFAFEFEAHGSVLEFIEADTSLAGCDCMCLFNLESSAAGIAPGTYTARLWTQDKGQLLGEAEVTIPGADGVYFETRCDTLIVYHNGMFTNCCAQIMFDFQQDGSLLIFNELDTASEWCWCLCYFDLTAQVSGLANGTYTVQVWDRGHIEDWDGVPDSLVGEGEVEISCIPFHTRMARIR